jgi:ubiquinone/menaquinone biosynthesis C-methylase UbiE
MFKTRSDKKELLDSDTIPEMDLFQNLKELDFINNWLGGYNITFNALKKIIKTNKSYTLVDIGSGGGDTLKRIFDWSKKNNYNLKLVGIDLKQACVNYSLINNPNKHIQFICDDYKNMSSQVSHSDIIHACLFCHHLSNLQIIELIKFAQKNKSILVINDLQRNPIAYYAIKWLTLFFSKSYLVKNDAPLSVARGFKKVELVELIKQAGVKNYSVNYKWAFRYEVIIYA